MSVAAGSPARLWTHPVAGAGISVLPALAAVGAFAALADGLLSTGAVALLAYLAMGTVAGFSVSGST